ncbi:MAG: tetratricopeptide repeat protein [Candidatus Riflebacteria bacterium]|jgi:tetratricopeptide (TPR) repeat protein|nr:tetratricopeptide repeat protein [Candidatus Riflebacteria bacterium]
MIKRSSTFIAAILTTLLSLSQPAVAVAQTDEDISLFLKAGQECYDKGELDNAALEFENILLIDRRNFAAQVWLAQVYLDKKDLEKARRLLIEASLQAPDHPRVIQLQKMLGEIKKPATIIKAADPVVRETLTLIGSGTRLRQYGLVIPENKVARDTEEARLLIFDGLEVETTKPEEKSIELQKYFAPETGPLADVFNARESQGLNAALDIYFAKVMADPGLASKDDRGLLAQGNEVFAPRFAENNQDTEARYYYGALQFINGLYPDAERILTPLKTDPGIYASRLQPVFAVLDEWRDRENQQMLALKRAEEERLAQEALEREEAQKKKDDIWAKLKRRRAAGKNASDSVEAGGSEGVAEAAVLHAEGYELYKKGKLDEAIAKYDEALSRQADNPEYNYHLGLAWTDKGLAGDSQAFDRAITSFQRVISLAPDDKLGRDAQSMIKDIDSAKKSLGE